MIQYSSVVIRLTTKGLNSTTKIKLERLSSNMIADCNNEKAIFAHKILLTNQVIYLRKAFARNSSANIKLPKTQVSKMVQQVGLLRRFLGPIMKNVLQPLTKSVQIPLVLTGTASATDVAIQKKIYGNTQHR